MRVTAALPPVPLSVLDLAPVLAGAGPAEALQATLTLARRADELGLTRFWVAEHHNMPGIASSAPAVLIGAVAAATGRIRVGSGGVMLPNHPPLVVAEQFGTLAALHPGRIDLGLGRAPGTDGVTAMALRRTAQPGADDFPEQLGQLGSFLAGEWPDGHPYARIHAVPHAECAAADLAARVEPVQRRAGGRPRAAVRVRAPLQRREHRGRVRRLPPGVPPQRGPSGAVRDAHRPGRVRRGPTTRPIGSRCPARCRSCGCGRAVPRRCRRPSRRRRVPVAARRAGLRPRSAASARRSAARTPSARRSAALLDRYAPDELMITTQVYDPTDRVRSLELTRELFDELPVGLQQPRQLSTSGSDGMRLTTAPRLLAPALLALLAALLDERHGRAGSSDERRPLPRRRRRRDPRRHVAVVDARAVGAVDVLDRRRSPPRSRCWTAWTRRSASGSCSWSTARAPASRPQRRPRSATTTWDR